jgi:hypothetical protein
VGKAGQGRARQGKAGQGRARQGKAGQGNEVNDLVASRKGPRPDGVYILRLRDAFLTSEGWTF